MNWGPLNWFDEVTFDCVAQSWDNPDWVEVTLHSYRSRWNVSAPDPRSAWLDAKVKVTKTLSLPALVIHGEADGVNPPEAFKDVPEKFSGPFEQIRLPGVGHFPQRQASDSVASHLLSFLSRR